MSFKGREAGRRRPQRMRHGWDFPSFRGVDQEHDAAAVAPSDFVILENADQAIGPGVRPRHGLSKETSVSALDSQVMGIWDLESYLE